MYNLWVEPQYGLDYLCTVCYGDVLCIEYEYEEFHDCFISERHILMENNSVDISH